MNATTLDQLQRVQEAGKCPEFVAYVEGWISQLERTATGADFRKATEAFMTHVPARPAEISTPIGG